MNIISIVGARPQFIKIAPLIRAFEQSNRPTLAQVEHIIVHTGQHYNAEMSDIFFDELKIPEPTINLGVGSGSHGVQTGRMLEKIEETLAALGPDIVLVYGDTNSTLAGALAAAKLHIPVAHVEAGLRSFNRRMPEEVNRVVADHISDLLLAPTPTAMANLRIEGLLSRAVYSGDLMYDAVIRYRELTEQPSHIAQQYRLAPKAYGVVTLHRAENTENPEIVRNLMVVFNEISECLPLIFPMHPRTAKQLAAHAPGFIPHPNLRLLDPIGYSDMLSLVKHARLLFTDSGGLQKEAFLLGCPTITLREETEWVETVQAGANILAGVEPIHIREAVCVWEQRLSKGQADFSRDAGAAFGDGRAAVKIRDALLAFHQDG